MKYAIVTSETAHSLSIKHRLQSALTSKRFTYDEKHPHFVITIGGDGTLLKAFHQYADQLDHVLFSSVHTGHLGFYTDWLEDELDELIASLAHDPADCVEYPLLKVTLRHLNGDKHSYLALNEATVRRYEGTMTAEVFIQNRHFELFKGDGLCVSTPTGSTGLNKSLGGAVIHPSLDTLQMTEIASLNNRVYRSISSPILIGSKEWIDVEINPVDQSGVFMTLDQHNFPIDEIHRVHFEIASERAKFALYRHTHFWDRVEQSFIGSSDHAKNQQNE
ncbi:MAG: NAD kinase [Aerococcus sp.]|nr:NAD kinase [Aerococcus sp.]